MNVSAMFQCENAKIMGNRAYYVKLWKERSRVLLSRWDHINSLEKARKSAFLLSFFDLVLFGGLFFDKNRVKYFDFVQ